MSRSRAAALLEEDGGGRRWVANVPSAFDRPGWYFDQDEQLHAAQALVDAASVDVEDALDALTELLAGDDYAGVAQAEDALAEAQAAFLLADQLRRVPVTGEGAAEIRTAQREVYDRAEQDLADAQDELDGLMGSEAAQTLLDRRVELAVARERYQLAVAGYTSLLTGDESPSCRRRRPRWTRPAQR